MHTITKRVSLEAKKNERLLREHARNIHGLRSGVRQHCPACLELHRAITRHPAAWDAGELNDVTAIVYVDSDDNEATIIHLNQKVSK